MRFGAALASRMSCGLWRGWTAPRKGSVRGYRRYIAYIWLRSQFDAVKKLPALLEGMGVSQVVVSTLDFVPCSNLAAEAIQARDKDEEAYLSDIISEVVKDGRQRGLDIHCRLVTRHGPPGICTENVTRSFFVSSQGIVSPCVFRNIPILENGGPNGLNLYSPQRLTFGDVRDESLSGIWRKKDYGAFRRNHAEGRGNEICGSCAKLFCSA